MKFVNYLQEVYCCLIGRDELYVNPTYDDLKKFRRDEYRFVADCRTKKLFIWDSYVANHYEVVKYLIAKNLISDSDVRLRNYYHTGLDLLSGTAELDGKTLSMVDADELDDLEDEYVIDKLTTREWGWLKKYMNIDELTHIQRQIKQ